MERENARSPRRQWEKWESVKPAPESLALMQSFVNTRNYLSGGDLLADAEEATAWLSRHGLLGEIGRASCRERV